VKTDLTIISEETRIEDSEGPKWTVKAEKIV